MTIPFVYLIGNIDMLFLNVSYHFKVGLYKSDYVYDMH